MCQPTQPTQSQQQRQTQQTDPRREAGQVERMQGGRGENPGPQNHGENQLPDSKRLEAGPDFHITVQFASNGETGHLRRTTLSPKDTTD